MAWLKQQRGPRTGYYYRHVRIDGKPVKLYVGRGVAADMAVLLDERKRDDKQAARDARHAEQVLIAMADLAADEAWTLVKLLGTAVLIVNGHYGHHGSWRRRR